MQVNTADSIEPTDSSDAQAKPKKGRTFLKIGAGCLTTVVLACGGLFGWFAFETYQQQQNYDQGHQAYLQADCASAVEPLTKAANGEPGTADSARQAAVELSACESLMQADALADAGDTAEAVMAYHMFVATHNSGPLLEPARERGSSLLSESAAATLASRELCVATDDLQAQGLLSDTDTILPPLYYACGQTFEEAEAYSDAVFIYQRFRDDYPEHSLAGDVEAAFVRATVAEAAAFGAGNLPAPQTLGDGSGSGPVTVIIQNDSPERLSMVFSGPEVRVEELEPCADCENYTVAGPTTCPELGPVGSYTLPPGDYQVVVKSISDRGVTPFSGEWELAGGDEYYSCFFLVTTAEE
jgi:hypothetical protein